MELHKNPLSSANFPVGSEFSDGDGFANAFSQNPADGKKIILAWDEFDLYPRVRDDRWREILQKFRALKAKIQDGAAPLLKACPPLSF